MTNHSDPMTELMRIDPTMSQLRPTIYGLEHQLIDATDLLLVNGRDQLEQLLTDTGTRDAYTATVPAPDPCPWWCDHRNRHTWYDEGEGDWSRDHEHHVATIDGRTVTIRGVEYRHGEVSPAQIDLITHDDEPMNPATARQLAAALNTAADLHDQITTRTGTNPVR